MRELEKVPYPSQYPQISSEFTVNLEITTQKKIPSSDQMDEKLKPLCKSPWRIKKVTPAFDLNTKKKTLNETLHVLTGLRLHTMYNVGLEH